MTRISPAGPWMNNLPALPRRVRRTSGGLPAPLRSNSQRSFALCRYRSCGFTLIELMVVMLLITIVLSVAIPRLDSSIAQDPRKRLTRWMVNTAKALRTMAVEKRQVQALVIDLDEHRMWTIDAQMDEEAVAAAAEKGFALPNSIVLADVEFPDKDRISSGTATIRFYPSGYADQALVHVEYDQTIRFSYKFEPLLPKIKRLEEWVSY